MIHLVRKVARAIHRRSVWPVLAVYLALAWSVFKLVEELTRLLGLPGWTVGMALALLAIGLPIVVATAVVQGGLPGLRIEDLKDPSKRRHLTPDDVLVLPDRHPVGGSGMFTWRNAILGGAMSAALLVGSVASYLAMWTFGIGPVGSLLAQGLINERDPVLVAEFTNETGEQMLGAAVTDAFELALSESPVVSLALDAPLGGSSTDGEADLQRPMDADRAREVATDHGVTAVLQGEIVRSGERYVVVAGIFMPGTGSAVASFRETARDEDALVEAVERLAGRVRERFGESWRSIRREPSLVEMTTGSVPALRLFAEGNRARVLGEQARAIELYRAAVVIDPGFATAWWRLTTSYAETGLNGPEEREAVTRAFENRERLSSTDRPLAEAHYEERVGRSGA